MCNGMFICLSLAFLQNKNKNKTKKQTILIDEDIIHIHYI